MIPDKLFINLKILSKIQKNGRIGRSFDGIISLEKETFYQSLKRFFTSDSRKQSVFEINSIIHETIECLNNIINSKYMNKSYCQTDEYYKACDNISLILNELELAKTGIENLKFTYAHDANIATQLDILIVKINGTLKDIQIKLDYFKSFLPIIHKTPKEVTTNYYLSMSLDDKSSINPKHVELKNTLLIDTNENENENENEDEDEESDDNDITSSELNHEWNN